MLLGSMGRDLMGMGICCVCGLDWIGVLECRRLGRDDRTANQRERLAARRPTPQPAGMTNWLGGVTARNSAWKGKRNRDGMDAVRAAVPAQKTEQKKKQSTERSLVSSLDDNRALAAGCRAPAPTSSNLGTRRLASTSGGFIVRSGPALMMVAQGAISGKWMGHKGRRGLERTPLGI